MKKHLMALILAQTTMAQAESQYRCGQMGHQVFEAFCRVWEWAAPRHGGIASIRHDVFWNQHGKAAYYRRINRVRAAFGFNPIN